VKTPHAIIIGAVIIGAAIWLHPGADQATADQPTPATAQQQAVYEAQQAADAQRNRSYVAQRDALVQRIRSLRDRQQAPGTSLAESSNIDIDIANTQRMIDAFDLSYIGTQQPNCPAYKQDGDGDGYRCE
jgi:hypothetical protein